MNFLRWLVVQPLYLACGALTSHDMRMVADDYSALIVMRCEHCGYERRSRPR